MCSIIRRPSMSWAAVNRISVDAPSEADQIVERFRHRAGKVDLQPGFLSFEVWREEAGKEVLVLTRWARKEDFEAWVGSDAFQQAHRPAKGSPGSAAGTVYEIVIGERLDPRSAEPPVPASSDPR
jgi:heme-degrading monooxygenase HmoA